MGSRLTVGRWGNLELANAERGDAEGAFVKRGWGCVA